MTERDALIEIRDVCLEFGRNGSRVEVLRDISLDVREGEFLAIVGPSGCGKSTLLNMIAGLLLPTSGSVRIGGQPVAGIDPARRIGYMFARDGLMPWRTTIRNVEFALEVRGEQRIRDRAQALIEMVGLAGFEHHYRSELSQGMRQRAALARTLATDPSLLLLDEPFGALDAQTKVLVEEEFLKIREARGITTILVTHDLMEAITLADRVAVFSARPARMKAMVPIEIPRPRSLVGTRSEPVAQAIYGQLWDELRFEAEKSSRENL